MKEYKEFQFAWAVIPIQGFMLFLGTSAYIAGVGDRPIPGTGLAVLFCATIIIGALFYGMTTTIDAEKIVVSFGVGLIRKRVALDKIKDVKIIKNPWSYGWGIRYIPKGKLYNIYGLNGVELTFYSTDRIIRIGTQNPAHLKAEIEKFVKP